MSESFAIHFRKQYHSRIFRAIVEITYRSDNAIRYKVSAGDKHLYLEKHLFKKTGQWKVTRMDFRSTGNSKEAEGLIEEIQRQIDYQALRVSGLDTKRKKR